MADLTKTATETSVSERAGEAPLLEARGIRKRYGSLQALAGVDLILRPGTVHAVLGENGAGKSTLMNVLFGLVQPDSGELLRSGRPVTFLSPRDAMAAGVGMVHQHFTLVPAFTVAENLSLGRVAGRYRPKDAAERIRELSAKVGLEVDPNAVVANLSVGMQQRVEILKSLARNAEILILDEPTGALTPQEIDELMELIRRLASGGAAVAFITHKLAEVERTANEITVLRAGRRVLTGDAKNFTMADLAQAMVGTSGDSGRKETGETHALSEANEASAVRRAVLTVEDARVRGETGVWRVNGASFVLREGEILGIAGVEGSGQTELAEAITGLRPATGTIRFEPHPGVSRDLTRGNPDIFLRDGGAHVPEDRRRTGLILDMPIWENLILQSHSQPPLRRGVWLNRKLARSLSEAAMKEYEIRAPSIDAPARSLSGGNQQKIVIAREMMRNPRLLVAVNPTRGLDIRTTAYVHRKILENRENGGATLLISSELDEIMALSDRIAVMHAGKIVADLPKTATREEIGWKMTRGATSADDAPSARDEIA
jgi:simple sugar transport system ATP-binding protein